MTATQAPTPGPLSGDDVIRIDHASRVHVPEIERRAENQRPKTRNWQDTKLYRYVGTDLFQWFGKKDGSVFEDPSCEPFRVYFAPTAPVEASGSEREEEPTELEMQRAEVVTTLLRYSFECGSACEVADEIIGLIRPQPSGETREAVARYEMRQSDHGDGWSEMVVSPHGFWVKYADILALLSARPLAFGGQQGEVPADIVAACKRLKEAARSHRCENGSTVAGADMLAVTSYVLKGPQS